MNFRKLLTYLTVGTAAVIPFAGAQNPTILQGSYISNVFGNSNFVLNPNAQTNVANVTTVTATVARSTTTPLVATSEFTVAIGTANGTATWATRAFDAGMKGQNCEARFTYRGFAATSKVHIKQGANTVASLNLTPATDPRIASINFPCGDLSTATTFQVTDTAILAGTNEIGGIYVGLATNMANVAQAEFVGSIKFAEDCGFVRTANTFATPTDASCTATATGNVAVVSGVKPGITINDTRPGTYRIVFNTSQFMVGANFCNIQATDGTTVKTLTWQYQTATTSFLTPASHEVFYQYSTSGTRTIEYQLRSDNNVNVCEFNSGGIANQNISVYRFPSSSELVVTPERQNTFAAASWTASYSVLRTSTAEIPVSSIDFSTNRTAFGKAQFTATANDVAITVPQMPAGTYRVELTASNLGGYSNVVGPVDVGCFFYLKDGSGLIAQASSNQYGSQYAQEYVSTATQIYTYTSVGTRTFTASLAAKNTNAQYCTVVQPKIIITPLDQPSNSALYVQGPVLGAQTGAAIPAGYLGKIEFGGGTGTVGTSATTGATTYTISNVTPGVYLTRLYGAIQNLAPNTTTFAEWTCTLTDNAALTFNAYDVVNYPQVNIGGGGPNGFGGAYRQHSSNSFTTTVTSTKNYYVRCAIGASGSGITVTAGAELIRLN